jgi:UDP-N-acetylmuramoyl-tripeptide--D-alanyl-D-alanine ligase
VINDSYNSNPVALASMAELLAATTSCRRRILAAGEMLELGPASCELHREAGRAAARLKKIGWIFGVGGDAAEFVRGAIEAGHPKDQAQFFSSSQEAAAFLAGFIVRGDLLLVKGSRGVRMERIVEALRAKHPLRDGRAASETVATARQERH